MWLVCLVAAARLLRARYDTQGHALANVKPPWRNPVRWREIYGNFSTLAPGMPPLWGTVKDSVDSLLAAGIQPFGEEFSSDVTCFASYASDGSRCGSDAVALGPRGTGERFSRARTKTVEAYTPLLMSDSPLLSSMLHCICWWSPQVFVDNHRSPTHL
jgi:hypothetical protein